MFPQEKLDLIASIGRNKVHEKIYVNKYYFSTT